MADVLGFFKKAMPFLTAGLSIAGPAGMAASTILGKVLNVQSPTVDSVQKALSSLTLTPELQVQLQEAENQFKQQMQAMGYQHEEELLQLSTADVQSARQMQVATRSSVAPMLAIVVSFGFFGMLAVMLFHKSPPETTDVLEIMIGSLGTGWTMILSYYFGTSAGHETLLKSLETNGNGVKKGA
ncbi:MAG TPA: hypothetical protein VF748_16050 [Candidatus Acidoferrum sp.]